MIAAILAISDNGVIGSENDLPWPHIAEDMKRFVELTTGNVVVMGRKTWDSLPKKPLPNRKNFVVTSKLLKDLPGANGALHGNPLADVLPRFEESFNYEKDIFVIGGAEIYDQLFSVCDKIFVTRVPGEFEGDIKLDFDSVLDDYELESSEKGQIVIFETWKRK